MRVGVTCRLQFSYFSGGGSHTSLAVAEAMVNLGHSVTLVNLEGEKGWWEDALPLADAWKDKLYHVSKGVAPQEKFDILFEIDPLLLTAEVRKRIAKRAVWIVRKPLLLHDIEATLFPFEQKGREMEGICEVWCFDHAVTRDDIQYLEVLTRLPVKLVPWLWTPSAVEGQRRAAQMPVWTQVAEMEQFKNTDWSVHVSETNFSASSSCTIPLVILREAQLRKSIPMQRSVKIHNAEHLKKNDYFHNNVTNHCNVEGLSYDIMGRQRVIDWATDPKSLILAHSRFMKIRPYVLEALWVGIPTVHNSELVKKLGHGCDRLYYTENQIGEACDAMARVKEDFAARQGIFSTGALENIRKAILEEFTPYSQKVLMRWKQVVESRIAEAPVRSSVPSVPLATSTKPIPAEPVESTTPITTFSLSKPATESKGEGIVRIGFSDMWENFQADYNPFLLMLQEVAGEKKVVGVSVQTGHEEVDMLVFGPFGKVWESVSEKVPKVHYTGENSGPVGVGRSDVKLNLGFSRIEGNPKYMRLPLWMLEVNWWNADVNRLVNPKPIAVEDATRSWRDAAGSRKKFCAFVVSNPSNQTRNRAFWWMNEIKAVDSAGRLFNTMGDKLFAGLGGGGGELKKLEFLKEYKYCFAYENSSSPGYTTEKLLHAKAAGCIPLYWGDEAVEQDFDVNGFLDMRGVTTKEEFQARVRKVEEDDAEWKRIVSVPALTEKKVVEVREHLRAVGRRMLGYIGVSSNAPVASVAPVGSEEVVYTTGLNWRFISSLEKWIDSIKQQRNQGKNVTARIYMMDDVPKYTSQQIEENNPWIKIKIFPAMKVDGFADWMNPQHFAWKVWMLRDLANDASLAGKQIIYIDTGVFVCSEPKEWMRVAKEKGICFLEDEQQKNRPWCHEEFCSALQVSESEKEDQQLWAGAQCFISGHPVAKEFFDETWKWAQKREVIIGPKWNIGRDGKPCGHRHDQSIMSIISKRKNLPRLPMRTVYCDESLRRTYKLGRALYVHRGNFKVHENLAPSIDEAYVINLKRRSDRWERFLATHEGLRDEAYRFDAYEGKSITLTPALMRLFKPHDFGWKKAIMGCALSHLELWLQLLTDTKDINSYLIMEDDVKFVDGWEKKWFEASKYIPSDWDVIYLGGILPPNRAGFEGLKEKVNSYFSRVKPNQMFGQQAPSRYFHFCNYSYILSRRGAQKIIDILKARDGYWTSADHMICNNADTMNLYFLDPLVAGCYQDDDPKYKDSAFNNYNRIDSFDSDLWNNDERFSQAEVEACIAAGALSQPIQFGQALQDAKKYQTSNTVKTTKPSSRKTLLHFFSHKKTEVNHYEREWLKEILGVDLDIQYWEPSQGAPFQNPIVVMMEPYVEETTRALESWNAKGIEFTLLHMSDENGKQDIRAYNLPTCKKVLRFYGRNDLYKYGTVASRQVPGENKEKIIILPLGYHFTSGKVQENIQEIYKKKNTIWSFHGTGWQNREYNMSPLKQISPYKAEYYKEWNDSKQLSREAYLGMLESSVFIPCPRGNNVESFRVYEALEAHSIPIVVNEDNTTIQQAYYGMLTNILGIKVYESWGKAVEDMKSMLENQNKMVEYHVQLLQRWHGYKEYLKQSLKNI
jgi:alpha(1,3/1,4) fucosyltransferase